MKSISRIVIISFLLFAIGFAAVSAQNAGGSYFCHTVERGQTLTSISQMYNVSISDIVSLNPGCENGIIAGSELRIPQKSAHEGGDKFHTIKPGETLYRLSVMYGVTTDEICEANPGLSASNFKAGGVVRIPVSNARSQKKEDYAGTTVKKKEPAIRTKHEVKRKETIYSICRVYGITEKELLAANPSLSKGLKRGSVIDIPYPEEENVETIVNNTPAEQEISNEEVFRKNRNKDYYYEQLNIAVILPFSATGRERSRVLEYYEGFLLAANEMKENGAYLNIYTYDSGVSDEKVSSILSQPEMKDMNIIFGPGQNGRVKTLSDFSKQNKIFLVVPFSFSNKEVFNNPYMFQINTPQSYLYSEVYANFIDRFGNHNVIFVESEGKNDKMDFVNGLKAELERNRTSYTSVKAMAGVDAFRNKINPSKENIFVPADGNPLVLNMALPNLTLMMVNDSIKNIHLFGYPEWQTYTNEFLSSFYEIDTYFYSSFYTNSIFPEALQYSNLYHKWYGKDMANSFPKYGMLGFDTGLFFMKGMWNYGERFIDNLGKVDVVPVQTGFRFERVNNWGGFINKKVFFIHFPRNYKLEKLDF